MTGNVWEWCADWFSPEPTSSTFVKIRAGPASGTHRVTRGGSYLCHASYCRRYRVAARNAMTPDSSSGNTGFRCAASVAAQRPPGLRGSNAGGSPANSRSTV